jgi:hypothetical protein
MILRSGGGGPNVNPRKADEVFAEHGVSSHPTLSNRSP